ncbi:MAG: Hpt domain-containing protein [Fibrobacter sp.]|nr:Hpt domain-containing protein [Fibrobacter sp.]
MTLQEFYASVDESLEDVLARLHKEERISKYLGLFLQDPSFNELEKAFEEEDIEKAFRAAHTLKGVAANLGFQKLYEASSALTEDLRPREFTINSDTLFSAVLSNYSNVIENIRKFLA